MKTLAQILEIIEREEKKFDFNDYIKNYIDEEELMDAVENLTLRDYFEKINEDREITDGEIIYYTRAIEYIKENDPSMMECFEIASDYWYDVKNLNSELLASLLKTRNNEEDYSRFIDIIIDEIENK